jgi:hypothetical protein
VNEITKLREYVEKSSTRYLPDGVTLDIALGEPSGNTSCKHS